jgi:hypothetical protein
VPVFKPLDIPAGIYLRRIEPASSLKSGAKGKKEKNEAFQSIDYGV